MTSRSSAPLGSPCWTDLWTSDVEGSRKFYSELFGWVAQEPSPEFGGYFMFTNHDIPVAGAMGDMGDMVANNTWKIYLDSDDIVKTVEFAQGASAQIASPSMAVADLGSQAVLIDPTGAEVGIWQTDTFPGFTVLGEHGTPSWFELSTRDYKLAVDFYRTVFHWETIEVGDSDDFRYSVMKNPSGDGELAGIMDAASSLPLEVSPHWTVYWEVNSCDETVKAARSLGGSIVMEPWDTPYGRMAMITDPSGAKLALRTAG